MTPHFECRPKAVGIPVRLWRRIAEEGKAREPTHHQQNGTISRCGTAWYPIICIGQRTDGARDDERSDCGCQPVVTLSIRASYRAVQYEGTYLPLSPESHIPTLMTSLVTFVTCISEKTPDERVRAKRGPTKPSQTQVRQIHWNGQKARKRNTLLRLGSRSRTVRPLQSPTCWN